MMQRMLSLRRPLVKLLIGTLFFGGCLRIGLDRLDWSTGDGGSGDADADSDIDADTDADVDHRDADTPPDGDDDADDDACPEGTHFFGGECRQLCSDEGTCPPGEHCVTVVCLPESTGCTDDCTGGFCQCADEICGTSQCSPVDCGCQYNTNGDTTCDGVLLSGVDNLADSCGPTLACNGLGGCQRALGQLCTLDADCGSGHCADGVCCAERCDGNCDLCSSEGLCGAVPDDCTGECPTCEHGDEAWSCAGDDTVCDAICTYATCAGEGTLFDCDYTHCGDCATRDAPNFTGMCGTGVDVYLPTSCHYLYEYYEESNLHGFWGFSEYECRDGTWVLFDADDDAGSCGGACSPEQNDYWSDTCGDSSALDLNCTP